MTSCGKKNEMKLELPNLVHMMTFRYPCVAVIQKVKGRGRRARNVGEWATKNIRNGAL